MRILFFMLLFSINLNIFSFNIEKKVFQGITVVAIIVCFAYIFQKYYRKKSPIGDSPTLYTMQPILKEDIEEMVQKYETFDLSDIEEDKKAEYLKIYTKSRVNGWKTTLEYDLHQKALDNTGNIIGYMTCQSYCKITHFYIAEGHCIKTVGRLLLENVLPRVKEAYKAGKKDRRFFEIEFDQKDKNLQEYVNLFQDRGFKQLPCRTKLNPPRLVWAIEWQRSVL